MSIKVMAQVWGLPKLTGAQKLVALAFADDADDDGLCWPSLERIAGKCNISARQVRNHKAFLIGEGLIEVVQDGGGAGWIDPNGRKWFTEVVRICPAAYEGGKETAGGKISSGEEEKRQNPRKVSTETPGRKLPPIHQLTRKNPSGGARARGARFAPDDFRPSEKHLELGRELGLDARRVEREAEKFRDHQFPTPKTDWDRTFNNWLRKAVDLVNGTAPNYGDWLT